MKIIDLIKKIFTGGSKLRTIGIIVALVFLVGSAVMNYFQDRWNDQISQERDDLAEMNKQLKESIKKLTQQYTDAQSDINRLEFISDSLEKENVLRELEIASKEKHYLAEIKKIKNIPPDTIYKRLFVYYPENTSNENILKYRFSRNQITGFYTTYKRLEYNIGLNRDLTSQITNLNFDVRTKDNIITNKDVQLGTLRTEIQLSNNYIDRLEANAVSLEKSYKSERRSKWIWQGVAGLEFVYIIVKSLKD